MGNTSTSAPSTLDQLFLGIRKRIANPDVEKELDKFIAKLDGYIAYLNELSSEKLNGSTNERTFILTDNVIDNGQAVCSQLPDRITKERLKESFRHAVGPLIYQSEIMRRGYEKKRGYPGDFELLEHIYDDREISEGLGKLFDRYFLENPLAHAVRKRKDRMPDFLADEIKRISKSKAKVLNLACGSSRDILVFAEKYDKYLNSAEFTCVDFDDGALEFSRSATANNDVSVNFVKHDVLKIGRAFREQVGEQDVIYSIGLVDYLPNRVFQRFLKDYANLLNPGGSLIFAHKDQDIYHPLPPEWCCDWVFYHRTMDEVIEMSRRAANWASVDVVRDPEDIIFFVTLRK